jgi:hypothetical protein
MTDEIQLSSVFIFKVEVTLKAKTLRVFNNETVDLSKIIKEIQSDIDKFFLIHVNGGINSTIFSFNDDVKVIFINSE